MGDGREAVGARGERVYICNGSWLVHSSGCALERGSSGRQQGQMRELGLVKANVRWRVVGVGVKVKATPTANMQGEVVRAVSPTLEVTASERYGGSRGADNLERVAEP